MLIYAVQEENVADLDAYSPYPGSNPVFQTHPIGILLSSRSELAKSMLCKPFPASLTLCVIVKAEHFTNIYTFTFSVLQRWCLPKQHN